MAHIKIARFAGLHSPLLVPLVFISLAKFVIIAAENDITLRNDLIARRFLPDDEFTNGNDVISERLPIAKDGEDPTICGSMDLRNNLESLEVLRPCRVIEGFLQILLIDNVNETALEQISFPDLVEITDFLLLFRVNGLRSVGQLFPNLAVIRGHNLFMSNKALIIFQMSKLEEIGLYSLTHIVQGSVHVDRNPSLCYLNTIDWKRIICDKSPFFVKSFKPENECPVCLDSAGGKACPRDPSIGNNWYCWNNAHCQKTCEEGCDSCNNRGQCCDSSCLGGCADDNVKNCVMCKDYEIGRDEQGFLVCAEKCPKGSLSYYNRRCITEQQCKAMVLSPHAPPPDFYEDVVKYPYKIFNETCTLSCPANYANNYERHVCEKCNTTCRKNCPGASIDSINLAKKFKGCTHITSSLEIQIRGGNKVVKELEENLNMIEEIDGYLKIVRSFSLVSLDFLKNLKRIGGKHLENGKYSLIILDNQNLLDMWDWTNRTLKIDRGTLFFHFNPKLCYSKIQNLINKTNTNRIKEGKEPMVITDLEVAHNSNGDKIACDVVDLNVNVAKIESVVVLLEWLPFKLDDSRKLLGYTVYHIVAPNRTVNFYDGRDACGQDNWHVDDVRSNPDVTVVQHLLTNLLPFTQYAFYIRTYTIASENRGAQSKITYFTTKPSRPVQVNMKVSSNSSESLYLTWSEPLRANGKITHYVVTGRKRSNLLLDNGRDYCKNPTKDFEEPKMIKDIYTPIKNDTCPNNNKDDSEGNNSMLSYEEYENDEWNRIKFEDALHNLVYIKRRSRVRRRRDSYEMQDKYSNMTEMNNRNNILPNSFPSFNWEDEIINVKEDTVRENKTENGTNIWEQFRFIVYERELLIKNLHHFTFYDISVQACRETIPEDQREYDYCGEPDRRTVATLKKSGADNITSMDIANKTLNSVTVTWTNPIDPNGQVVSVIIKYKREDTENAQPNKECISINDFKKYRTGNTTMRYTMNIRYPGNYSLCLKSTSLAGDGEYQICKYFVIDEQPNYAVVITISVLLLLFLAVAAAAYWMYRKTLKERELARRIKIDINMDYASIYEPDDWEVSRKKIELVKELGQGSFGMVWEGMAHDIQGLPFIRCAVKTVNEHATERERSEFLKEASVMKAFDTTHVVKLLGVVSQGQPTLVIMELMTNGDLKTYLRSLRPDVHSCDHRNSTSAKVENHKPPTLKQILQMAIEIADGMAYLESKKYVHRDLAARNCMVAEDLTVKIGDFGMTRDIYETDYYRKGTKGLLPVRWMAPESLKDGVFSSNSDVWSYGVVLWEMATLASQPYQGLSNDQVLRYVIDGGVMERPENCPDKLYTFMRFCWQPRPSLRPSFMRICQLMLPDAKPCFPKVSFYHSLAGTEARKVAKLQAPPSPPHGSEPDVPHVDPSSPFRRIHGMHLGSGYTPSESQESDEMEIDHHHHFPPISEEPNANGYVGARIRNGAGFTGNNHAPTTG